MIEGIQRGTYTFFLALLGFQVVPEFRSDLGSASAREKRRVRRGVLNRHLPSNRRHWQCSIRSKVTPRAQARCRFQRGQLAPVESHARFQNLSIAQPNTHTHTLPSAKSKSRTPMQCRVPTPHGTPYRFAKLNVPRYLTIRFRKLTSYHTSLHGFRSTCNRSVQLQPGLSIRTLQSVLTLPVKAARNPSLRNLTCCIRRVKT